MARISIIIPMFNEEDNVLALHSRLCEVGQTLLPHDIEILMVDDGSTDGTARLVSSLRKQDSRIRLLSLSRNFGSHAALAAGFQHSSGDATAVFSADLQDPPELLQLLVAEWQAGSEIVLATRKSRQDSWFTRLSAASYYFLVRRLAMSQIPQGGVDVCLVDHKVIESLGNLQERNTNIICLIIWAGFTQSMIHYHRGARKSGKSKWSMEKKIKLLIDSFVSFSFVPIRMTSIAGFVVSLLGFLYAIEVIAARLVFSHPIDGWASLMVVLLGVSGLQLIMLGINGEYLWRALDASRNRPSYIIRHIDSAQSLSLNQPPPCLEQNRSSASSLLGDDAGYDGQNGPDSQSATTPGP